MKNKTIDEKFQDIENNLGVNSTAIYRKFIIGKENPINAALVYINALASKDTVDKGILNPLMLYVNEDLSQIENLCDYLTEKYITAGNATVEQDFANVIFEVKRGKTILFFENCDDYIIIDTTGGVYRAMEEPPNETTIRGSREGFVENIETNISILRRKIKDDNLVVELLTRGDRTQSDIAIVYIDDIVDKKLVEKIRNKISSIDVDKLTSTGVIEQYIEEHPYSIFPQVHGTERPDKIVANILEGRIAIILQGTPYVITAPALFIEFFQSVEDYSERTIVSNFIRFIRVLAVFIVITVSPMYLTLIKYNIELLPLKFVVPIIQSRIGIPLTPFMEIMLMEIVIELLREGGLRLPTKVGQTLSVVGGIIIGDAAIKAKIVSPETLLVVVIAVISTFLIPNYEMQLSIRLLRFPMLILADAFGALGIVLGWFFIIVHLCSLDSFGIPYLDLYRSDMKDIFIRKPLWMMNKRPESIPNTNTERQTDFRSNFKGDNNE